MIDYTIDDKKGIIYSRFSQGVNLGEAAYYLQRIGNDPRFKASYGRLVIIESGAIAVDISQTNHMQELWEKTAEKQSNYACAIVCEGTSEALLRYLMHDSSIIDSSVRFFSSISAAESWLETKMSNQKNA